ncbi:MAG: glycosyltransferase family 2 protein [Elusimicrobia bacterium]|nr:glycosyltransferase family 2 protein [Elusimicrobiota bacterium]
MAPFFSVVIDNHNYGRFLNAAVQSALDQDFNAKEIEVIVVDDGSNDNSRQVLESFRGRIRAVFQERRGQASAFNRGFEEARGEVVCLLDSDDSWEREKLSAIAPLFDDEQVGGAQHWLRDADSELKPLPQTFPRWPPRYALADFLDGRTQFTATSALAFRRQDLLKALPIPGELFYYLDDFLSVGVLFQKELANLSKVLGRHRLHGANFCAGGYADARKLEMDFRMRRIFREHLKPRLAERGLEFSPRAKALESLELWRREVLYHALKGDPAAAWRTWAAGAPGLGRSSFSLFRRSTVLLAALSPSLYLSLYSLYVALKSP